MRGFYVREPHQVTIITPFNREFVDELKDAIPYRSRSFDPEFKTWTIRQPYTDSCLEICAEHFDAMRQLYAEPVTPQGAGTHGAFPIEECLARVKLFFREEAALYVIPDAPWPVVQSAYRAAARIHHPDVGGSNEAMKVVNLAYAALTRRHENSGRR